MIFKEKIPTKQQWKKWTLPSKYTIIGTIIGIISLLFSFYVFLYTQHKEEYFMEHEGKKLDIIVTKLNQSLNKSEQEIKNISILFTTISNIKTKLNETIQDKSLLSKKFDNEKLKNILLKKIFHSYQNLTVAYIDSHSVFNKFISHCNAQPLSSPLFKQSEELFKHLCNLSSA